MAEYIRRILLYLSQAPMMNNFSIRRDNASCIVRGNVTVTFYCYPAYPVSERLLPEAYTRSKLFGPQSSLVFVLSISPFL